MLNKNLVMMGLLMMTCSSSTLAVDWSTPLAVSNQNPLARIYGIPVAENARLLAFGEQQFNLSLDVAYNFTTDKSSQDSVFLDGESTLLTLRWRYGLGDWEIGLDLPYVHNAGGELDGFIDEWHQTFGLPEGDRINFDKRQVRYEYSKDGQAQVAVSSANAGVADLRFTGAHCLYDKPNRSLALNAAIKAPTGDSDSLRGSGGYDISVGASFVDDAALADYQGSIYGSGGWLWTEKGDVLSAQRQQNVLYGSLGLALGVFENWQFKLQLDAHSAFYDNDFSELGGSTQLSIGGAVRLNKHWLVDFAVVEDIVVESASDVNFHLNLRYRT